jgi:hypothetical protein
MSGASEAGVLSQPLTETALRASMLLALVTVMTGCGGGGSAEETSPTRPPVTAGTATLFPGDEAAQAGDAQIDFPRADPGESAEVDVTVANTSDEPMKVETTRLTGESAAPGMDAPTITDDRCKGEIVPPRSSCRFKMLIPPDAADGSFEIEVETDQGDVTAAVVPGASGRDTTTPGGDPRTHEPAPPTAPQPPDTGLTTGPTTGPTDPGPDPDTAPDTAPDTEVPPAPDTEVPPVDPT